jgi:hypothetical protein
MAYITDENGNYKRTVRCGYCYEKEHNKSACPKRKVDLKQNIEDYTKKLAENKFSHDYERSNIERYLRNAKDSLHKMETRGQNRKCGFCGEEGHTRRTCSHRKAQVAEQMAKAIALRKSVAQRMQVDGFGPGALISVSNPRHGSSEPVLAVVTHIDFENMKPATKVTSDSYFDTHRGISFQYVVPMEDGWGSKYTNGSAYINLAYMNVDNLPESKWYRSPNNKEAKLLSGVAVSEDQLLCEEAIDEKQVSKWIIDHVVDPK